MEIKINVVRPDAHSHLVLIEDSDSRQGMDVLPQAQQRYANETVNVSHRMNSGSGLILDWMRKRQIEMAEEQKSKSVEDNAGPAMTRRSFTVGAALATLAAGGWMAEAAATGERNLMLAGTQTTAGSKGIYAYQWNASTGALSAQAVAAEVVMPTFLVLAPDGQLVYCANELVEGPGRVTAFRLDRAARKLTEINTVTSKGAAPCHVAVDRTGHALFAANYTGGSAASFQIAADGRVSEVVSLEQFTDHGPNKERQEAAHAASRDALSG